MMVSTGEGWKYTMIKTSKDVIECKANSYPSFDFDWAPKASEDERLDFNALELDPDCAPASYLVSRLVINGEAGRYSSAASACQVSTT